jgi:hypothetical protein
LPGNKPAAETVMLRIYFWSFVEGKTLHWECGLDSRRGDRKFALRICFAGIHDRVEQLTHCGNCFGVLPSAGLHAGIMAWIHGGGGQLLCCGNCLGVFALQNSMLGSKSGGGTVANPLCGVASGISRSETPESITGGVTGGYPRRGGRPRPEGLDGGGDFPLLTC